MKKAILFNLDLFPILTFFYLFLKFKESKILNITKKRKKSLIVIQQKKPRIWN